MRLLTEQVLAAAAVPTFPVGDAEAPKTDVRPYVVVYPLFISDIDGPTSDVDADGWYQYQATCVGITRQQAQGLADEVVPALTGYAYTVSGYSIQSPQLVEKLAIERDDSLQPPLYYQSVVVQMFATPT
jgi:hypothetical protein